MISARSNFCANLERVDAIRQIFAALSRQVTGAIDVSDLLRFEVVQVVSAIDCLVHDVVQIGMMEIIEGKREETEQFQRFRFSMGAIKSAIKDGDLAEIEREIRERHSYKAFQMPDRISDAFRLISQVDLWAELEGRLGTARRELKQQLSLIVDRRNKIVHEGDLSPVFPRTPWPISAEDASKAHQFIQRLGDGILTVAEYGSSS